MTGATRDRLNFPHDTGVGARRDTLTEILRAGALDLRGHAVPAEVAQWIDQRAHLTDEHGHRQVVRNGYAAPRTILTGVGPLQVTMPRVHDRRPEGQRERFTSRILPPYLRKAKSIDELIPLAVPQGGEHR